MKKFGILILCLLISNIFLVGCSKTKNVSTIKYERKLGKYFETETNKPKNGMIDLSEGPKLRYDAKFGPRDLNFDIKIENPY